MGATIVAAWHSRVDELRTFTEQQQTVWKDTQASLSEVPVLHARYETVAGQLGVVSASVAHLQLALAREQRMRANAEELVKWERARVTDLETVLAGRRAELVSVRATHLAAHAEKVREIELLQEAVDAEEVHAQDSTPHSCFLQFSRG